MIICVSIDVPFHADHGVLIGILSVFYLLFGFGK